MADEKQTGGLQLDELKFGTLNNLGDVSMVGSGDPRRGNSQSFLNTSLNAAFARDSLKGVGSFHGIVIDGRAAVYPAYARKDQLLTDIADEEIKVTEYFVYKVYIPEVECRPYPKSLNDPVLLTYADVYPSKVISEGGAIPPGTVVKVQYSSIATLSDPMIVERGGSTYFSFEGMDMGQAGTLWKKGTRTLLGGGTFHGDRFADEMVKMGYRVNKTKLTERGDLDEQWVDLALKFFEKLKAEYGSANVYTIRTGRDDYHYKLCPPPFGVWGAPVKIRGGGYFSQHCRGKAFDMSLKTPISIPPATYRDIRDKKHGQGKYSKSTGGPGPTPLTTEDQLWSEDTEHVIKVTRIMRAFQSANPLFRFLDEYNNPTPAATGGHFHIALAKSTNKSGGNA